MPGYKPTLPAGTTEEPVLEQPKREPKLPDFVSTFGLISKDQTDAFRQQQMEEILSIRDYLAKPIAKVQTNKKGTRDNEKEVIVDIPTLKVFERAILLPTEEQCYPLQKKYPVDGENLTSNPNAKKKGKKGGKGKKKKKK